MMRCWYRKVQAVLLTASSLVLLLAVACGGAAPATPAPAATKAPAAASPPDAKAPAAAAAAATAVPTPAPTAAKAAAPGKPKVNKLIMALTTPGWETLLVWAGSVDHHSQHDLVMESLVDIDPQTNGYIPELAYKWEMSPDGKAWTFWLNKGVQFHDNWGEFTAKDVAWSVETQKRPDTLMAFASNFKEIDTVEVVNDYQVVLRLKNPDPDYLFYVAPSGGMLIQSKAFWDAKGLEGYQEKMIGTGPYLYRGRQLGVSISYERLPNHWRVKPTDWPEFQIRWVPEASTRMAMLLAKEVHVTELPKDLTGDVLKNQGMKLITSRHPANQVSIPFGGLHFNVPEKFDPSVPWANPQTGRLVRQALNKAVNKEAIAKQLFSGRVTISPVVGYYPNLPGWNPAWLETYDKLYGYDPAGAKKLLGDAGYPNGFKTKGILTEVFGFPEASDLMQALQIDLHAVGVDMVLDQMDFARRRAKTAAREAKEYLYVSPPSYKPVSTQIRLLNYTKGGAHVFEDQFLDTKYEELQRTIGPGKRGQIQREIGDYLFEQFPVIPLFYTFIEMVVDPQIVDDWPFPGSDGSNFGHFDLITACTTPTPCR